jgi:hypothetical protein
VVPTLVVLTLTFLILGLIWTIRSKEWLQTVFVSLGMIFLTLTNPDVAVKTREIFTSVIQFLIDLVN